MTSVIFDCDTGIDDSVALLYLLGQPAVDLAGIISTAGNVPVQAVLGNNLGWLELLGRDDIPVYEGAAVPLAQSLRTCEDTHGPLGIGYAELPAPTLAARSQSGAQGWIELTAARPGELVGLVTGPLTTLAEAIRLDPDLPSRLRRLVVMGGSVNYPGNTSPTGEWNVMVDPEAAAEVFAAFGHDGAPPVTLCALPLTEQVVFTPELLGRLAGAAQSVPVEEPAPEDVPGLRSAASNPVIRRLTDALRFYFEFHESVDEGYLAHLHDPLAAAVAVNPNWIETTPAVLDVELGGTLTRGTTVADFRGFWNREPNALIGTAVDVDAFFDDLIDRIAALARTVTWTEPAPVAAQENTFDGDPAIAIPDGIPAPDDPDAA